MGQRITKRTLGTIQAAEREFTIWEIPILDSAFVFERVALCPM